MRTEVAKLMVWCSSVGMVSCLTVQSPLQKTRSHPDGLPKGFQLKLSDPISSYPSNNDIISSHDDDDQNEPIGQANTRFSAFAPATDLSTDDFRAQLKANMMADLERRRREDPNRGNQPAKSYLDSL